MSDQMTIKFWGVRGSYPTPFAENMGYGGNTSCVEVTAGAQTIILDAGSGIIQLGRELVQRYRASPINATLLLSHLHHDHTQGFPFFAPIHFPSTRLSIFGPEIGERTPEAALVEVMHPSSFPVGFHDLSSKRVVRTLHDKDQLRLASENVTLYRGADKSVNTNEVVIRTMRSDTHPGGVMFYRIEWQGCSVVYATDTERALTNNQQLIKFARGADLLIHDAQYTSEHYLGFKVGFPCTKGWGHSTPAMACDVARAAGVKQLAFFHYDPSYDDEAIAKMERKARKRFHHTIAPTEGMSIMLPAIGKACPDAGRVSPSPHHAPLFSAMA